MLKKGFDKFVEILNALGCVLTMLLMLIIVIDVCGRYFFNHPFVGVSEVVVLSIVIIAFFQVPFVQLEKKHLKSTVFYDKMNPTVRHIVDTVGLLIGILIFSLLLKSGWDFLIKAIQTNEYDGSGGVRVTTIPTRAAIVIGSFLMIIIQVCQIVEAWFGKKDRDKEETE